MTYKDYWKALANAKAIKHYHVVQYCLIKAVKAKSNNKVEIANSLIKRAFTPVSNKKKLEHGAHPFNGLRDALHTCRWRSLRDEVLLNQPVKDILDEAEYEVYKAFLKDIDIQSVDKLVPYYTYILVRQDISPEQQLVQASHATLVLGSNLPKDINPSMVHFVVCGFGGLTELMAMKKYLQDNRIGFNDFIEPDIGDEMTAIATLPVKAYKRDSILRQLPLLKLGE